MEFNWDFPPYWRVVLENGLIIPENRLLWKHIPALIKHQNTRILKLELDLGYGIVRELPKSNLYYCSYRFGIDLRNSQKEELKIIGWGNPVQAYVYAPDGTFFIQEITNPQEPFLLKI